MNTQKTAPDFGEPWYWNTDEGIAYDRTKGWCPSLHGNGPRLVACLNACAGMSDPAAEIQALRDAVKEACDALEWAIKNMNPPFEWEPFTKANATLSKLQSLA